MKNKRLIALYSSIVIIIAITLVNSIINTKSFDLKLPVSSAQPEIQIDNVLLEGKLIKFPLNLYYIKGYLTIGDNTYKLTNYRKSGFNPTSKVNTYQLELIHKGNEDYVNGDIFFNGDIIQGNLINININMNFMDMATGYSYSQVINTSPIQD
jgi:hypothetical protein